MEEGPTLRIWAPRAARAQLELAGGRLDMHSTGGGWWSAHLGVGTASFDYSVWLDGEGPFPDPRSRWQPHGVHGPSRWIGFEDLRWTDAGWRPPCLAEGVTYELHVGTFTPAGTFEAVIERLDHLVQLGVTHVQLMPVAEFSGARGWGYDGVDLYAPHHVYGGPFLGAHRRESRPETTLVQTAPSWCATHSVRTFCRGRSHAFLGNQCRA